MNDNEFAKSISDLPVGWQNYLIKARYDPKLPVSSGSYVPNPKTYPIKPLTAKQKAFFNNPEFYRRMRSGDAEPPTPTEKPGWKGGRTPPGWQSGEVGQD